MTLIPDCLESFYSHGFDTVIDVRSPAEFEEDRIPGAINLPVLDNEERARVGTIYKQESPFKARKLGAALVFRNAANHIERHLAHHEGGWRPLVYCWRGGQRSGSFTWMLREIGWRAEVVPGGYRTYRRLVTAYLYDKDRGVQVLDLEGLARHRGSLLGEMPGGQPAQKGFETDLARALCALDPARPVVVEAESSKIGQINLPPALWDAMKTAPWVEVSAPIAARAEYLAQAYDDILSDAAGLREKLAPLRYHRGHEMVDRWEALIDAGDRLALCRALAEDHYDPAYRSSMRAHVPEVLHREETPSLAPGALDALADRLAARLQTIRI